MKILVADDEGTSRHLAESAARSLGHECHTVGDGHEAWEALQSESFDVVISDWLMPGLSGLDLCRLLRTATSPGYTYFIMVTGRREDAQILEGMKAGADDYLLKPLDPHALHYRLIAAERVSSLHKQLGEQRLQLEGLNYDLTAISLRDPLTSLGNRRALEDDLEVLEARSARYGHRYCLALLDIDHFKSYNDTYGHQAGDKTLQDVASVIKTQSRGGDGVYRYGGEEFLCVFPEQSLSSAAIGVERMRARIFELAIEHEGASCGVLTLSAGLAMLDPEHPRPASEVLKEADDALYRAKEGGRNRVEGAPPLLPLAS